MGRERGTPASQTALFFSLLFSPSFPALWLEQGPSHKLILATVEGEGATGTRPSREPCTIGGKWVRS